MMTSTSKKNTEIPKKREGRSALVNSISGNLASMISVTLCFPLEVMKTRLQIQVSARK